MQDHVLVIRPPKSLNKMLHTHVSFVSVWAWLSLTTLTLQMCLPPPPLKKKKSLFLLPLEIKPAGGMQRSNSQNSSKTALKRSHGFPCAGEVLSVEITKSCFGSFSKCDARSARGRCRNSACAVGFLRIRQDVMLEIGARGTFLCAPVCCTNWQPHAAAQEIKEEGLPLNPSIPGHFPFQNPSPSGKTHT